MHHKQELIAKRLFVVPASAGIELAETLVLAGFATDRHDTRWNSAHLLTTDHFQLVQRKQTDLSIGRIREHCVLLVIIEANRVLRSISLNQTCLLYTSPSPRDRG